MEVDAKKIREILRAIGAGVSMDERSWESRVSGFEKLTELTDEELAAALLGVQGAHPAASQQLQSIREMIRLLADLRASKRQKEQADALIEAVQQLKRTEGTLEQVVEKLGRIAPLIGAASNLGGSGR